MRSFPLFLLISVSILLLTSCESIEQPTLDRIEDVNINEMSTDKIDINANMIIKNPNSFELDLASADIDVIVDDIILAKIQQTYDTKMPANSEFKMPVQITMDLKKLYTAHNPMTAIAKGLKIMSDKQLDVTFKGTIKAGKGVAKINIDVNQVELVKFR